MDRTREEAEARIKEGGIDPVGIHVRDACVRIKTTGLAVLVCHSIGLDDALTSPDRAGAADIDPGVGLMLLDDQPLLARLAVLHDARGAIAEGRIHVAAPEIERLENVTVRVNNVVSACHWRPSETQVDPPKPTVKGGI